MSKIFRGTGVALVTPFKADLSVDEPALRQIVDAVIAGGVDLLVALGTTAETPTLSKEEQMQVLDIIIDQNKGRKPIVVGIGGNNTAALVQSLPGYPMDKIDGILSVTPYYNKPSQEGMYQHFKALATATDKPIILYNVPGRTSVNLLPETALRLAHEFRNIAAIKEASGSIQQCMQLVQGAPAHFSVLSGDDNLTLAQIGIGMDGVISVAANCYANDFCSMVNAALQEDFPAARLLHYKILNAMELLFAEGNPAGVKAVLHNQGLCENVLRLPLVAASSSLREQLKKAIQ